MSDSDSNLLTEDWLRSHRFTFEDGAWHWRCIALKRFDGHWRINLNDWWEYFPNQTREAISGMAEAMGWPLASEECDITPQRQVTLS